MSYKDLGPEDAWRDNPPPISQILATAPLAKKADFGKGFSCHCEDPEERHVDVGGTRFECHDCACLLYRPVVP